MSARLKEKNLSGEWQEKYHQVSKTLDEKTRQWKTDENNLYKSILRLILSYSGSSSELDRELQSMRDTLKQGADDATRKRVIEDVIEKTLESVQQIKQQTSDDEYHANLTETIQEDRFDEFLRSFSLPGEPGLELASLKKKARELQDDQARLDLVDESIKLLQRIYRQQFLDDNNEVIDFVKLRESLIQLMEWLPISKQYHARVTDIKNKLNALHDEDELKKIFRKIATLITDFQASLQEELTAVQGFLKNITLRLKDIESHIHQVDRAGQESNNSSTDLNATVQTGVREIRSDIEQSASFEDIKKSINRRLMGIEISMDAFIKAEQDRRKETEQHVEILNRRLIGMKQDADNLQLRIQKERDRAKIDALTGIPNRLAYDERIQEEFNRWQRYRQPLSICIVDIDKFKNVNDTYGHKAGDKVLVTVAELCNTRIRDIDFFARYGGEEFVIILPQTALGKAKVVAENLRHEVDECNFHYAQAPVAITVSCGLAEFKRGDSIESVFQRADNALYTAKQEGRNCCRTK